jgi:ankyrin repeat protein
VCLHVQRQDTPLHVSAINGHEAVTRVLVEAGADVNAKESEVQSKCAVVGCVLMEVVT